MQQQAHHHQSQHSQSHGKSSQKYSQGSTHHQILNQVHSQQQFTNQLSHVVPGHHSGMPSRYTAASAASSAGASGNHHAVKLSVSHHHRGTSGGSHQSGPSGSKQHMHGSSGLGRKGSMPETLMSALNSNIGGAASGSQNLGQMMVGSIQHHQHPQVTNQTSAAFLHLQQAQNIQQPGSSLNSSHQFQQQRGNSYGSKHVARSKEARMQQYSSDAMHQHNNMNNTSNQGGGNMHVGGKLIKSHAKYFSQQNSPVHRQSISGGPKGSGGGGHGGSGLQGQSHHGAGFNGYNNNSHHLGNTKSHQKNMAQKQGTQTGMGTISGGSNVDPQFAHSQSQQAIEHRAGKYVVHNVPQQHQEANSVIGSLQNTLDADNNMNTFGAASTVAQNMENDYMMTMECNQYRQSLDHRRHSHQTVARQQPQFRQSIQDNSPGLVNSTINSTNQSKFYGGGNNNYGGHQGQSSSQQRDKSGGQSKQNSNSQKQHAQQLVQTQDYHHYRVQMPDGQYRTFIQHPTGSQEPVSGQSIPLDQQYSSFPQQPNQDYIKKYHSQNQGPVLSQGAQNQTVLTTTNNSFVVSQTLSHGGGPQNQSTLLKNVKQKYDESFLNSSINNASNAVFMVDSSAVLPQAQDNVGVQINQTLNQQPGSTTNGLSAKRHSHNNSVIHQSHNQQIQGGRVSYDPRQRQFVASKGKQRQVNTQMSINYEKHKNFSNNPVDQPKSVKKQSQKSSDLQGYRYKNISSQMGPVVVVQPQTQMHHQQSNNTQPRASSGSGYTSGLHNKQNTKRTTKAQTRPVSNKKQQIMTQQSTQVFNEQILQNSMGSNNHPAHIVNSQQINHLGDNNTIIRNKYAISQSAHSEMQHGSFYLAQVSNSALRDKKKSIESSTHSQSINQYRKTAMPITTVPSQKKLQNNQSINMNHSGSVLVPNSQKSSINNSQQMSGMPTTVIRSKGGQSHTTKTSPQRKQLGAPFDSHMSSGINMLNSSNATLQKMNEYKKTYQQNTFQHHPQQYTGISGGQGQQQHTSGPQQQFPQNQHQHNNSVNEQPQITLMPSQLNISSLKQIKSLIRGKNSSEMNFYDKRMSQHQLMMAGSKQRTASINSSGSFQKAPMVSAASTHSRHSQNNNTLNTSQKHQRGQMNAQQHSKSLLNDRSVGDQSLMKGHYQFGGDGNREFEKQAKKQSHHNQSKLSQNHQHSGYLDQSINAVVIRPSQGLAESGRGQLRQQTSDKATLKTTQNGSIGFMESSGDAVAAGTSSKGATERISGDYHHKKQLNLNDSSNIHVEDSLRESVVPQNSKSVQGNSISYGGGTRVHGQSKSQHGGRGHQRVSTTGKMSSNKFSDQNNTSKNGQSQKNLRKYNGAADDGAGDGTNTKVSYAYQSNPAKSQANNGQSTKRLNQHGSSLSMSQMLIQKGINIRQSSHSSSGFHPKNTASNQIPPAPINVIDGSGNSQSVNMGAQSQSQLQNLMGSNGLTLKAAHIIIKGSHTTSANTAVNTAKNSPRIMQSKPKSIHSGGAAAGGKSHSSVGPTQNNNFMQPKSAQVSERHRDTNNKSVSSAHGSKQQLNVVSQNHIIKTKSQQKHKHVSSMVEHNPAYPSTSTLVKSQQQQLVVNQNAQALNLNTIGNYQQNDQISKSLASQYVHGSGSNSQKNINTVSPGAPNGPAVYLQFSNAPLNQMQSPALQGVNVAGVGQVQIPIDQSTQQLHSQSHHQWYGSKAAKDGTNRKLTPQQVMDGGTGSVSKLENSQDQIDSFQQSSKQQKNKKIERKTQNILKNAQRTAQIISGSDQDPPIFGQGINEAEIANIDYMDGPLITEEDEAEIRQVASDINEKAFFGKILRTKSIIEKHHQQSEKFDQQIQKLSPRSQEIAFVMKKINDSFKIKKDAPETSLDFYRIGKMLGRGAFGKVNLAMHKLVRKLVALKSLNKECLTDEVQKQKLMKEVNLLLKLRHDNVVKIYETIETKKHIIIVMELCAGGDLLNYVRKRRRLKEPVAKKIFKQIIDGLKYIHSKYVAHRDIKLDNILLDGKGQVKIADFGVSKQSTPGVKMRDQCGTPAYIAPEILRNKNGYTFAVDLWSAGVVLYAMLYGTVPFKAASMDELHSLILRGIYTLKDDISQEARDMLRGLLEINPHKRLNYDQINSHPWLADMDSQLQLFNQHERELIKKEYTYNDPSRYNRNENEEPIDCFTEHNIDSVYNTMKNCSEKSIILAPFNSTQSEDIEVFKKRIKPMIMEKALVLRLSRLCREVDRQYEFNNNGQLDNGVYHKQLNNSSEDVNKGDKKKKDKKDKKDESSEDDELKFQVMQCSRSQGRDFPTEEFEDQGDFKKQKKEFINNMLASMTDAEKKLIESTFGTNHDLELDDIKINHMVQYGYPKDYIIKCLQENLPNYTTAGYYLLKMDQTYT